MINLMNTIKPSYSEAFGFSAAFLTTVAFLPQLIKTWRTKTADDISILMLITFLLGVSFWIVYAIQINSLPVLIANIITFIFNFSILVLKISYRKNK